MAVAMKVFSVFYILLFMLALCYQSVAATDKVTRENTLQNNIIVSAQGGVLRHGEIYTIRGIGFGVKIEAKPYIYADFDQQLTPLNKGLRTNWVNNGSLSSVISAANSNQALRFNHNESFASVIGVKDIRNPRGELTEKLYMFNRKYYDYDIENDAGPNGFNLKMYRFWADFDNSSVGGTLHFSYQGNEGIDSARMTSSLETQFRGAHYSPVITHKSNTWLNHELIYQASQVAPAPDTVNKAEYLSFADGIYDVYEDGIKWKMVQDHFVTRDVRHPNVNKDLFFDQVSNGAGTNTWVYYDEIYIDTTWQRIIIGNAANWDDVTETSIQIPMSWSENQLVFEVNQGDMPNLNDPLWLYVFNEDNEPNSNGVLLTPETTLSGNEMCFPIKSINQETALVCL